MKKALLITLTILMAGCSVNPEKKMHTSNMDLPVSLLATTQDGCKIYKFSDGGDSHYFVNCSGKTTTNSEIREGKTTRKDEIETIQ